MRKIYILLLLVCSGLVSQAGEIVDRANEAYGQEDYIGAIALYEQALQEEGVSSDLYYNLGNACYKHEEYAKAILNYERALSLNPGNSDARFNLDMANTQITDKIDPVGQFFLSVWIESWRSSLSANAWAMIGVISFLLFIAGLYLYLFVSSIRMKKIGFFGGLAVLLVAILANCFAFGLNAKAKAHSEAIVFAPTVSVKSSPAESGTDLFILHEGTKVSILETLGEWAEIKISDGNRGWLPSSSIEVI